MPEEATVEQAAGGTVVEDAIGAAKVRVVFLEGSDKAGFEAPDRNGVVVVVGEAEAGILRVEGLVPVDLLSTVTF